MGKKRTSGTALGLRLPLGISAWLNLVHVMLFVMRWQKRVKFPTVWVFVNVFRAAHVSNGSPETCLINSYQALTCSWASASSYLQNIPEERELSPLFPQNSEGACMNSVFFMRQSGLASVLVSSNTHSVSCSLWHVFWSGKQRLLLLRVRLVSRSAASLVFGEILSASSLKSLLFCENC